MNIYSSLLLIFFITTLGIATSCTKGPKETSSTEIIHPTEENLISSDSITHVIDDALSIEHHLFRNDSGNVEIGVDQGDRNYMFGRISSIAELSTEDVLILDDQHDKIRAFDKRTGEYKYSFSAAGRGPGEVMHPSGMAIDGQRVFLADRMNKVEVFENPGTVNIISKTMKLTFSPNQICSFNDLVFIAGVDHTNSKTVHKFDTTELEYVTSFHDAYKSDSYLAKTLLSYNRIACNKNTETVIIVNPNLPHVYGYSLAGNLRWVSKFDNFNLVEIIESLNDEGRPSLDRSIRPNGITDIYSNLISIEGSDDVLLQMNRLKRENGETVEGKIMSFRIDGKDGSGYLISTEFPFIYHANEENLISLTTDPFPKLTISPSYLN